MINVQKILQEYSDRRELTASEKTFIIKEYNRSQELGLINFIGNFIVEEMDNTNYNIPHELIFAFVSDLESKRIA
jgi:hypothetical protein